MCEKCFVQTKNYSNRSNLRLWENFHLKFNQLEKFLQWGGSVDRKQPHPLALLARKHQ